MQIEVPAARKAVRQTVPPAGEHQATVKGAMAHADGEIEINWGFRAEGRAWTLPHQMPIAEFVDLLAVLGFAGQALELEAAVAAVVGAKTPISVRTRGGRKSAFVERVGPL